VLLKVSFKKKFNMRFVLNKSLFRPLYCFLHFQKKSLEDCQLAQEMTAENVKTFSWASLIDDMTFAMPFFMLTLTAAMPTCEELKMQDLKGKYIKRYTLLSRN
jgi:hypothetical protein